MYKYQSDYFNNTAVQRPDTIDMKYLRTGKAIWNLTRQSINKNPTNVVTSALQPINYSNQAKQKLLRYHVLPLKETMGKFLETAKPLLTSDELKKTQSMVDDFVNGPGEELQDLLEAVGKKETNWLAHRWLKAAYLQYRDPVTVYVSPCMTFPVQKFADQKAYLDYTSKVMFGLGEFKNIVDAGKIPVVKMGQNELDNSQFGKVFGTCRIPIRLTDEIVYNPNSKHVVVIHKNNFYKMSLYNRENKLLSASVMAKQLREIMNAEENEEPGCPIGILTTDNRDNWAEAYEQLCKTKSNVVAMKDIQSALFTVSLDQCTPLEKGEETNQLALQLIHGGGSEVNSANRWMDKTIQLVVNPNGNSGFTYEHSPAEGQPIAMMMDYVVKKLKEDAEFGSGGACDGFDSIKKLKFGKTNECVDQLIHYAQVNVNKLAYNLQMHVMKFDTYGKNYIKKMRLGPDSYVQMALQLAFYTLHKKPAAQYESAHLRIFDEGRTETIRSCSEMSVAFCKIMTDPQFEKDYVMRANAMREAINDHQNYAKNALQGRGIDRHMLGLKLMACENCMPVPEFYKSPGFVKSSHFRMSTSQVATKYDAFMAYGPATSDGYACCYNPRDDDIILAVSAWRLNQDSDLDKFVKTLRKTFVFMKDVLDKAEPGPMCPQPKSKL